MSAAVKRFVILSPPQPRNLIFHDAKIRFLCEISKKIAENREIFPRKVSPFFAQTLFVLRADFRGSAPKGRTIIVQSPERRRADYARTSCRASRAEFHFLLFHFLL